MKRLFLPVFVLLVLTTACSPTLPADNGATAAPTAAPTAVPEPDDTAPPQDLPADSRVFMPDELLSAAEASELTGHPVTLEEGSLYRDDASCTVSLRYVYDLGESTTIHALLQIEQDSLKPAGTLMEGNRAADSFAWEQDFSRNEISDVPDLGDGAFVFDSTGQLHMLYRGYYIVVAFELDEYDSSLSVPLNIEIGRRVLENLKAALGE